MKKLLVALCLLSCLSCEPKQHEKQPELAFDSSTLENRINSKKPAYEQERAEQELKNYFVIVSDGIDSKSFFNRYKDKAKLKLDFDNLEMAVVRCSTEFLEKLRKSNKIVFYGLCTNSSFEKYSSNSLLGSKVQNEVRIAVLDTGIDERFVKSKSFHDFVEGKKECLDLVLHGTAMAKIIKETFPKVSICSYRITKYGQKLDVLAFAAALETAIKEDCDIANMSMRTSGRCNVIIEKALERASKKLLLIAAAENKRQGNEKEDLYLPGSSEYVLATSPLYFGTPCSAADLHIEGPESPSIAAAYLSAKLGLAIMLLRKNKVREAGQKARKALLESADRKECMVNGSVHKYKLLNLRGLAERLRQIIKDSSRD